MTRWLGLALTAVVVSAVPTTLPDPSFEAERPVWTLTCEDGATGTMALTADARTGKQALRVEKTNGLGFLLLTSPLLAVTAGQSYESSFEVRVERADYGSSQYFVNADQNAAGETVYPVHYSPHFAMLPRFAPPGQWQHHAARWTANPAAVATALRFVVAGNPMTLVLDDATFGPAPPAAGWKGKIQSSEPPFNEAVSRANLARRTAEPSRVELVSGRPVFVVGDNYRSALIHQSSFWSPAASKFGGFGQAGIHLQTIAVQFGPLTDYPLTVWKYPGGFDFSHLEHDLLQAVGADPQVRVILLVRTDAPRAWTLEHLDQVWTAENGQHWICPDGMHPGRLGDLPGPKETLTASYGSPLYQEAMAAALSRLGQWLNTKDVGKLVVGFMVGGNTDGQFLDGGLGHTVDHSPGHQQGFRAWLRGQYASDAALREAWGDPAVTLATATVPAEASRKVAEPFLRGAGAQQRAADANRFDSVAPARCIQRFARALKDSLGRPAFAITYWADAAHDQGGNRYALLDLLSGPDRLDAVATVQEYAPWRMLGHSGATNGSWATNRLHRSVPIVELDYRTYLSSMGGEWGPDELGATTTAEGFQAQIRRDLGASAARGGGAWFYDMGGVWFDDPPLWATIAEGRRVMDWAHRPEAPPSPAKLAVFVDEEAGWRVSNDQFGLLNSATNAQRRPLNLSGVPYDMYLLDDLADPKLPDYQAYLFLSSWCLRPAHVAALRAKCLRAGKLVAFVGGAGVGSVGPGAPGLLQSLTGLTYALRPAGAKAAALPAPGDPLAGDPAQSYANGGTFAAPVLVPADARFTPFGRFVDDHTPSHGVARGANGTVVQIAGGLTPDLIHRLAVAAGIGTLGTAGQVTYVGSGVAVAHRVRPGELAVTFERPVDLLDTNAQTVLARGVTTWRPDVALWSTALVLYRPAQ